MFCIAPGCRSSDEQQYLVEFPRNPQLADRWRQAIELGTGKPLPESNPASRHLCLAHFGTIDEDVTLSYQEPNCFVDGNGSPVHVTSCRLCLRFDLRSKMFPKTGKMQHVSLSSTIRAVMKICLAPDDFLTDICERCLIRIDVLKSLSRETLQQEIDFRDMMDLVRKETNVDPTVKVEAILDEVKDETETGEDAISLVVGEDDGQQEPEKLVRKDNKAIKRFEEETQGGESDSSGDEVREDDIMESSSDDDDEPLVKLVRKRPKKDVRNIEVKKRGRKPKSKQDVVKVAKKKRGRKPGPPKPPPVRQEYLRNILDKKCYICDILLENNDELVAHLTELHAGKVDYRCDECKKSFGKVTIYNRHLSCHDITIRPRKCSFCTLCFSAKESLKVHENKIHGADHVLPKKYKRGDMTYQCEACGKIFRNDALLRQHDLFVHKKVPAATCKLCGKNFATKANLEKHYIVHSQEKPYKCDKCDAAYKTSTALTRHTLRHQNVLPFECRYCDERFPNQGEYDRHRYLNHKSRHAKPSAMNVLSRSIPCALCPEIYHRSADLQYHINESHANDSYPYISCPQCPQRFLQQEQLITHMNIHTDLFVCALCDKHHSSASQLKDHMTTHNQAQPWQCTICLKRFSLQSNFSRHRLIHLDEKRFQCDLCDKAFSQKGQLMNHRRTHTGERPFTCPVCMKSFGDRPTFYKHRKRCMERGDGPTAEIDRKQALVVNSSLGIGQQEEDGCDF
ncbi:zinc finger and SCAN domain-containing protein 2-like [Uranotaenia lowii]|uniref:zinc finger and SCAN domain-containing protein 2-like n=1 Tax=Uranotaenia lowii TaxID=190385 RepID=UPI00247A86A7|nr:zinc finger and SCAN domain-containing protein 2-like [Uranotaenia lowii]